MAGGIEPGERPANLSATAPAGGAIGQFLAASARHGAALLAASIFGGLLVPPLAHACRGFVTPAVAFLMTFVLLRIDLPGTLALLRRPLRLAVVVGYLLVLSPLLMGAVSAALPLDRNIAGGAVLFATGAAAISSPAFARIVDLDAELSLLAALASTFLVPFVGPPLACALTGLRLSIGVGGFMLRLCLLVGLPLLLAIVIRRMAGAARLERRGAAIDGLAVWMVVLFGFGIMDGVAARILTDPGWVAVATAVAFGAAFGLNAAGTLAFLWMGRRPALSVGLMAGNRNMALYLAALPATADRHVVLFFVLAQFPLFLSTFLLRPLYRRLLRPPVAALPGHARLRR